MVSVYVHVLYSGEVESGYWNTCVNKINRVSHITTVYTVDEHGPRFVEVNYICCRP